MQTKVSIFGDPMVDDWRDRWNDCRSMAAKASTCSPMCWMVTNWWSWPAVVLRGLLLMEANGRYVKTSIIALPMYAVFVKKMSGGAGRMLRALRIDITFLGEGFIAQLIDLVSQARRMSPSLMNGLPLLSLDSDSVNLSIAVSRNLETNMPGT